MYVTMEAELYKSVGEKIKSKRVSAALKQSDVASKVGVSRASVVNIEQGRQHPSLFLLWKIATCLNIELTELLPTRCELQSGSKKDVFDDVGSILDGINLKVKSETFNELSEFMNNVKEKRNGS